MQRKVFAVPVEHFPDPPELLIGQKAFALPPLVLANVEARVRAFGPDTPFLRLVEHGAKDFTAAVGSTGAAGVGKPQAQ